jgi:SAM-dependent methyltransferase
VLDVGAGVGRVAGDLARSELVEDVFAVEQSPELVREVEILASGVHREVSVPVTSTKTLRAKICPVGPAPKLKAVEGDAHDLPFPDASFPCALALGLLDRVLGPRAVADELARVLEPGGIVVVSCLHDFSGGPADTREWVGSAAEVFAGDGWASGRPRNQRLDLRQNARYIERFNAEIVVVRRSGSFRRTPSPSRVRLVPPRQG